MIDLDYLARQTAGDIGLQAELLALLRLQLEDLQVEIDRILAGEAEIVQTQLMPNLHRVRGAACAVGAVDLAQCLADAEARLAHSPAPGADLASLRQALGQSSMELASLIAARKGRGLAKAGESR